MRSPKLRRRCPFAECPSHSQVRPKGVVRPPSFDGGVAPGFPSRVPRVRIPSPLAAGHYLAKHWRSLNRQFVVPELAEGRTDNFSLVIVGRSDTLDEWKPEQDLPSITPARLEHVDKNAPWRN